MKKIEKIIQAIAEHKGELRQQFKVSEIGIFGSYVRGEAKKGSDLDVLVEFSDAPGIFEFLELRDRLSKFLGIRVDLVMKDALKPALGRHILREMVVI